MPTVFPPPNLHQDNSVKGELELRRRAITAKVEAVPDERLLRPELEAEIANDIVDDEIFDLVVLGDAFTEDDTEQHQVAETNPMYSGPSGSFRTRKVEVFVVRRALVQGSPQWLFHRPSGSLPLLREGVDYDSGRRAVVLRVYDDVRDDRDGRRARQVVHEQLELLDRYVTATNAEIAAWNHALPGVVLDRVRRERERRRGLDERKRRLGLPVVAIDAAPIPYSLPRKRRPRVRLDEAEVRRLGGRMYLPAEDFAAVLNEFQGCGQFFAEHPDVYALDEPGMRDFVLAILNGAFPAATGETFTKRGRSDIRVVTTLAADSGFGDCVFKAECKVWGSPATARKAVDQLCDRYLTEAEVRAAIVLFARPPFERGSVTKQAIEELASAFGATLGETVAGWPTVRLQHPQLPHPITVAVIVM